MEKIAFTVKIYEFSVFTAIILQNPPLAGIFHNKTIYHIGILQNQYPNSGFSAYT